MSFAEALQSKPDQTQQSHPSQAAEAATVPWTNQEFRLHQNDSKQVSQHWLKL
jgi:hypothetical protein